MAWKQQWRLTDVSEAHISVSTRAFTNNCKEEESIVPFNCKRFFFFF